MSSAALVSQLQDAGFLMAWLIRIPLVLYRFVLGDKSSQNLSE